MVVAAAVARSSCYQGATKSLTIRGFIQRELADQRPAFYAEMAGWLRDGRIRYREDLVGLNKDFE